MNTLKRSLAYFVVLAMILVMIPFAAFAAEDDTYIFDATALAPEEADKVRVEAGSTLGTDNYFVASGTVEKRTNSDGSIKAVELAKNGGGAIGFTVLGTGTVTVVASSTGGTNDSDLALLDADGNFVASSTGETVTVVTGTAGTAVTYSVGAGTYSVQSKGGSNGRGTRIISITVEDISDHTHAYTEVVTPATCEEDGYTTYSCDCGHTYVDNYVDALGHNYVDGWCTVCDRNELAVDSTYTFVATDLTAATDKEEIGDGAFVGTNGYFLIEGSVQKRISSGVVKYVELGKELSGKIYFEVTGTADVSIGVSSTGGSNDSLIALVDAYGDVIPNNEGITMVNGTGETTITYTGLTAGYYYIVSPVDPDGVISRNTRVFRVSVDETAVPMGTETSPYVRYYMGEGTVDTAVTAAGASLYYEIWNIGGMTLKMENAANASIIYNGETYIADKDDVITIDIAPGMGRMPTYLWIANNGTEPAIFSMTFAYPAGTWSNPEVITDGAYTVAADDCQMGYYYSYTAAEDGTVTFTITSEGGWQYCINNMTTYIYGDNHWSDDNPVVSTETLEVSAGDVLEIVVGVYDPISDISFEISLEPVAAIEKFDLIGANVDLGNALAMNFFIAKGDIADETYYVEIVKENGDGTTSITTIPYADFQDYYGIYWQVSLEGLAAKEMADAVSVIVYNGNGVAVSNPWNDSMRDYCVRQLEKPAMSNAFTLLVDMLNYGAAAQTNFGYNTDDLANSTLTAEQAAYATQNFDLGAYSNNMTVGANFIGSSLSLETNIVLSMYFNNPGATSAEGLVAKVTYTDHLGTAQVIEIAEKDFLTLGGLYGVAVDTLVASDVQQLVSLEVYDGDTLVVSGADSMESYAVRQGGAMNTALMIFTLSAYDYLH